MRGRVAGAVARRRSRRRAVLDFCADELARILRHGPWPPPRGLDPATASGKPEAIALGEQLFFEPRLSGTGSVSCATCHRPGAFTDGRARGFGREPSTATRRRC